MPHLRTTPWADRLRKGTQVRVPVMDCEVVNACTNDDGEVYAYRVSIKNPELPETFWMVVPAQMIDDPQGS